MTTITHKQILALHNEASQAGDLLQAAICQIVLYGEPIPRTYAALSPMERNALRQYGQHNGWNMAAAIVECERVIADAAAQERSNEVTELPRGVDCQCAICLGGSN